MREFFFLLFLPNNSKNHCNGNGSVFAALGSVEFQHANVMNTDGTEGGGGVEGGGAAGGGAAGDGVVKKNQELNHTSRNFPNSVRRVAQK